MYQTNYINNNYNTSGDYNQFIKKSLERLTAHFGDYGGNNYLTKTPQTKKYFEN